ncbi:MAG: TIM-barrel domain-containing protein [Candidatus Binatia bacterium]
MRRHATCRLALFGVLVGVGLFASACGDNDHSSGSTGPLTVSVNETAAAIDVRGGASHVHVNKNPFLLTLTPAGAPDVAEAGTGLYFVTPTQHVSLDQLETSHATPTALQMTVASAAGDATVALSFPREGVVRVALTPPAAAHAQVGGDQLASPTDERIYGLLERTVSGIGPSEFFPQAVGSLDRRGTQVTMSVLASEALYTPFFQTSRGYGVFVEGTTKGNYDLASTDPTTLAFEFQLPPGVPTFSYLCIGGPSHDQLLDRYTAITGRPFIPPEWAFKHWRWRDEHRIAAPAMLDGVPTNADLVDDISHYEQLSIPVGNYEIDRPWATGDVPTLTEPEEPGFGDLIWDEVRFPNPQQMIDALNRRGYHLFLWVAPWATGVTTNAEAIAGGYLAPHSRFIIDFTNPAAVDWWSAKIEHLVRMGLSGLKLDRGDEDTPSLPSDVYFDGRTGAEMRNAYPDLSARVHHDAVQRVRGNDFLVYPRSGYAGTQHWTVFSAGDVPGKDMAGNPTDLGLRSAILAVLHNAFNGFPIWGSDTGGYEQFGDREVFARWIEFSAFCPIMEIGGTGTHAPWDMPTDPNYDQQMIDIYRTYTVLHHALVPYTYQHALEAGRSGRPITKPLVFNYPNDPRVGDLWEEFLYGDDILVAPVWQVGQLTQPVYLPAGQWVDYWNRQRVVTGPADLDEPAPLDRIPIFVRAGAKVLGTF